MNDTRKTRFIDRIEPAVTNGGFEMDGYWVWGGSVTEGDDGDYHMFASRWSADQNFMDNWNPHSEIVRATADRIEGPYEFEEVVLEAFAHNPTITRDGGTYLLYFLGHGSGVSVAVADSIRGPWDVQTDLVTNVPGNPAPVVRDDGSIAVVVKAGDPDLGRRYDVYVADEYQGPYVRAKKNVFDRCPPEGPVEDPAIWKENGVYHMVSNWGAKAGFSSTDGFHAVSKDAIVWDVPRKAEAFDERTLVFDDGTEVDVGSVERPQIYTSDGRATHLFVATSIEESKVERYPDDGYPLTSNECIPLRPAIAISIPGDEEPPLIVPRDDGRIPVEIHQLDEFNPRRDVDIHSLRFGAIDTVDDGRGARPVSTSPALDANDAPGDLTVFFESETLGFDDSDMRYVAKLVGETMDSDPLVGYHPVTVRVRA